MKNRRFFIKSLGLLGVGYGLGGASFAQSAANENLNFNRDEALFFKVSLAEWSFHRALKAGTLDNLDFPAKAKNDFGINAVEYVNQFFKSAKPDYLKQLKQRCEDAGVISVLIMCDDEGELAS